MKRLPEDLSGADCYAIQFLSGDQTGRELKIHRGQELIVGRGRDAHLALEDEKVSRRHSRLFYSGPDLVVEDLGSSNGTYVNGTKTPRAVLKEGDHLRIGRIGFKLIVVPTASRETSKRPAESKRAATSHPRAAAAGGAMSGSLDALPMSELLPLLAKAGRTGVLVICQPPDEGRLHIHEGRIIHATINEDCAADAIRTATRMMLWRAGTFSLQPAEAIPPGTGMGFSAEMLLDRSHALLAELGSLATALPADRAVLAPATPLTERLRDLPPHELDMVQWVIEHHTCGAVLDHAEGTEAAAWRCLAGLLERGVIRVVS